MRLVLFGLALGGCATYGGGACVQSAKALCEACPHNDFQDGWCACIEEGTMVKSDLSEGYQIYFGVESDTDAAMLCSQWLGDVEYPGPDGAAQCKQTLEYVEEWDVQACPDLGWTGD